MRGMIFWNGWNRRNGLSVVWGAIAVSALSAASSAAWAAPAPFVSGFVTGLLPGSAAGPALAAAGSDPSQQMLLMPSAINPAPTEPSQQARQLSYDISSLFDWEPRINTAPNGISRANQAQNFAPEMPLVLTPPPYPQLGWPRPMAGPSTLTYSNLVFQGMDKDGAVLSGEWKMGAIQGSPDLISSVAPNFLPGMPGEQPRQNALSADLVIPMAPIAQ